MDGVFSWTLESFLLTFHEWISSGMGLLDAESLVLYELAFILSWDGVVVELWGGGSWCFGGIGWIAGRYDR